MLNSIWQDAKTAGRNIGYQALEHADNYLTAAEGFLGATPIEAAKFAGNTAKYMITHPLVTMGAAMYGAAGYFAYQALTKDKRQTVQQLNASRVT